VADLVSKLRTPKAVWLMLRAEGHGGGVNEAEWVAAAWMTIVIDCGNSMFKDDVRRAKSLQAKGIPMSMWAPVVASGDRSRSA